MDLQFKDTLKARIINQEQTNPYVKRGNKRHLRSQLATYDYLKAIEKAEFRITPKDSAE